MTTKLRAFAMLMAIGVATIVGCSKHTEDDPRTLPDLVRVTTVTNPAGGSELFTGVVAARVESNLKRIGCLLSLLALPLGASLAQSAGSTNNVLTEVVDIPMPARRTALSRIAPGSESLRALGRHRVRW
jgi:hypothetical protein